MKHILIIIIISAFSTNTWAGGPWPQKKGGLYLKLSEWWTIFDEHYTDTGLIDPNVTNGLFNTTLYTEYGLTDRFTGVVNAALFSRNYMNNIRSATTSELLIPGEAINSIGDIDLSLKYGLTKPGAKIPIAITATFGIPTGVTAGGEFKNLQTGDGEFNQMIQIDAGTGFNFNNISAYTSAFIGLNNRTRGFSEELRFGLELGFGFLNNKFWINGRLNAVESLKNGDTAATTTSTSVFANNSEYVSLGVEANLYITNKLGISAGMASATRGEIIAADPSYSVGVFLDLK